MRSRKKHTPAAAIAAFVGDAPGPLTISGSSMEPTFRAGDTVRVSPCTTAPLRPGRCYVFERNGTLTLHRYVSRSGKYGIFMGDNMVSCELVALDRVVGEVDAPAGGTTQRLIHLVNRIFLLCGRVRRWLIRRLAHPRS